MPHPINVVPSRTLKLTNALFKQVNISDENQILQIEVEKIDNYIKSKASHAFGPVIQYNNAFINDEGDLDFSIFIIRQSQNYINHVDEPYKIEAVYRAKDCLYARFIGEECNLKHAFNKMSLYAYEEEIKLSGSSYTIFVDRNDDEVVIDIFMPKVLE